jgi:hypothetical protein
MQLKPRLIACDLVYSEVSLEVLEIYILDYWGKVSPL